MILKEKLFLANCDSVRRLSEQEVRARFMAGVLFADGVVLSPNLLMDNPSIISLLSSDAVQRWFKSDRHNESKLVIRGFNLGSELSLAEYFTALDDNYVVSQLGGVAKKDLTSEQWNHMMKALKKADETLSSYQPAVVALPKQPGALTEHIHSRLKSPSALAAAERQRHVHLHTLALAEQGGLPLGSSSDWYAALGTLAVPATQRDQFRLEVVDACYNGLFVAPGEAFVMDRIAGLSRFPPWLLESGIAIGSRRETLAALKTGYDLFSFISTLGSEELAKLLAEKALEYVEEKAREQGVSWCARRNWFGLYPTLTQLMGVELKR